MPRSLRSAWPLLLPCTLGAAYALGHLSWYLGTPLGQVPVLDERENLALAQAIFGGTLPAEPFYRAPGYALLLAGFRALGVSAAALFPTALVFGALLHAFNATLVASIARRWFGAIGGAAAGGIFALHPVLVHYATQALDATPALTCFLLGLGFLAPELSSRDTPRVRWRWIAASLAWAGATLLRPNYLLVWSVLPLLAVIQSLSPRSSATPTPTRGLKPGALLLAAASAGVVLFAAQAAWQSRVSGVSGFLPWQGPYNLWAANQPGAHGRYYVQRINVSAAEAERNPARAESLYLYQRETGRPMTDLATFNAYWRDKFIVHAETHPLEWLATLGRKAYALANDWEQYNNKTYAFHQARSPWLRWNPLGWGVCLVLAVAGAVRLAQTQRRTALLFGVVTAAVALSVLLFFVSARFRLPLAALAVVLAGGAIAWPPWWRAWSGRARAGLAVALGLAGGLAFSRFDRVRDPATMVQDYALLARAAASTGADREAWEASFGALELQPAHRDARRIAVASYFNELIAGTAPRAREPIWANVCEHLLGAERAPEARDLRAVAALAFWRGGERREAVAEWQRLGDTPSAQAALVLTGNLSVEKFDPTRWTPAQRQQPLVQLVLNPTPENERLRARLVPK